MSAGNHNGRAHSGYWIFTRLPLEFRPIIQAIMLLGYLLPLIWNKKNGTVPHKDPGIFQCEQKK